jgi:hypothetical protein
LVNSQACDASVVEGNHDVHLGLAPIRDFAKGRIALAADDATARLRELADAMGEANDPKIPCLPAVSFVLDSLASLWNRAYVSKGVLSGAAGDRYLVQLQSTQIEAWLLYIKMRANSKDPEGETAVAVRELFDQLSEIWHGCGDRGRLFALQAGSAVSGYFANRQVRNTFQALSDLIVETLGARLKGAGRATLDFRRLLDAHLAYWRSLITENNDLTALADLQAGLCFRLGGIAELMRSLEIQHLYRKVLVTFSQIVNGLAKGHQTPLVWINELRQDPGHERSLDKACTELWGWSKEMGDDDRTDLRRSLGRWCPFLQGREPRRERIPLRIDALLKLGSAGNALQARAIDVDDPGHDHVKLEAPTQALQPVVLGDRLNVSFQDGGVNGHYSDKPRDIPCEATRACEPTEVGGDDWRGLVVKLDSAWVRDPANGWDKFVNIRRTA